MYLAQKLYEAGHISYMRTDNPNLSDEAVEGIQKYGAEQGYPVAEQKRMYKAKAGAQEGHEAIRPTHIDVETVSVSLKTEKENEQAQAVYQLIRTRAIASQCEDGMDDVTTASLLGNGSGGGAYGFTMKGCVVLRQGWRALFAKGELEQEEDREQSQENNVSLPVMEAGDVLCVKDTGVKACKTKPPGYFTEASLIRKLEAEGVGRPSTYASIMDKIRHYGYVEEKKKKMWCTGKGDTMVNALDNRFAFMHIRYTREVESALDEIAAGKVQFKTLMSTVDNQLAKELDRYGKTEKLGSDDEEKTVICSKCGRPMRRIAKQGKSAFWGCSGYNDGCDHTMRDRNGEAVSREEFAAEREKQKADEPQCPKCLKGTLRKRKGRNGLFLGCTNFPECRHTQPCPEGNQSKRRSSQRAVA
jgi:DNA topoisomerase-1